MSRNEIEKLKSSRNKIEKRIVDALMGKSTISLGELYAYAMNTDVEEIERAIKESNKFKLEILKAMKGLPNEVTDAFKEWKYGQ